MTQLRCPTFVTQTTCWSASAIFGPCRHSSFPFPAYTVHTKLLPISSKFCFKRSAVISFNKIQFFLRSSSPISWVFEINRANLDRAVAQYSYSEIWDISPTIITAEDWTLELFLREIVQLGHFTTAWQVSLQRPKHYVGVFTKIPSRQGRYRSYCSECWYLKNCIQFIINCARLWMLT